MERGWCVLYVYIFASVFHCISAYLLELRVFRRVPILCELVLNASRNLERPGGQGGKGGVNARLLGSQLTESNKMCFI